MFLFEITNNPLAAKKIDPVDKYVTSPVRLALTPQGKLLLSDYQSQTVLVIDPLSLGVERRIKIKGRPTGVNGDGRLIYVGNETTGNVEVFGGHGKLKATLGDAGIGLPNDIAIDHATGQLFVVDAKAHHVRIFDAEGKNAGIIPAAGIDEQLAYPTALTIDPEAQLVYVSDQGPSDDSLGFSNRDARVRIYRYDGTYVDTLIGEFTRPQGLTINPDGYLYLADGMLGQVLVFDLLSKTLVKTIGTPGTGAGQLSLPLDVVVNPDNGDLLVANNRSGRLELFVGGGVAP
jgi:DNA-binding beta-propeller fold protein YncE